VGGLGRGPVCTAIHPLPLWVQRTATRRPTGVSASSCRGCGRHAPCATLQTPPGLRGIARINLPGTAQTPRRRLLGVGNSMSRPGCSTHRPWRRSERPPTPAMGTVSGCALSFVVKVGAARGQRHAHVGKDSDRGRPGCRKGAGTGGFISDPAQLYADLHSLPLLTFDGSRIPDSAAAETPAMLLCRLGEPVLPARGPCVPPRWFSRKTSTNRGPPVATANEIAKPVWPCRSSWATSTLAGEPHDHGTEDSTPQDQPAGPNESAMSPRLRNHSIREV
jgi:hypothetical protein